jgi:hypothetical protein
VEICRGLCQSREKAASGNPIGALWTRSEVKGRGCVMLMIDVNRWELGESGPSTTHAKVQKVVENVFDYMVYCGDHDLDGTIDTVELANGTDPADPDDGGSVVPSAGGQASAAGGAHGADEGGAATTEEPSGGVFSSAGVAASPEGGQRSQSSADSGDDAGCGCRLASQGGSGSAWLPLTLALGVWLARRSALKMRSIVA